jgi:3-isopropylmalate/(R)-2-methylmalate dehydratase large subunit
LDSYANRILFRTAGGDAQPGEKVELTLDRAVLSGAKSPSTLLEIQKRGKPRSAEDLILTMDFHAPEVETEVPRSQALCRELSQEFDLRHVFDLNMGIGSHVVLESVLITPGQLIVGSGRCLGVLGGIGALPLRLDPGPLAGAVVAGMHPVNTPEVLLVAIEGRHPRHLGPMDIALAISSSLGSDLEGKIIELTGDAHHWGVDLRVGVCGLLPEMGALAAVVAPDDLVVRFFKERGVTLDHEEPGERPEAARVVNVKEAQAVLAEDYRGTPVPLRESERPVQGVYVGGCYGGRYDDLSLLAEVLKRKGRVHPGVRLAISPATLETTRACLAAGFYETFLGAGAMVVVSGGGPGSAGGGAIFGEGERIASTAEYHRHLGPGQGVPEVLVMSAGAAAVAAVEGKLLDPASYLA